MSSPTERLRIAALEPYAALSHTAFLAGLVRHSRHEVVPSTLPPRSWKWRMRTAALHFARVLAEGGPWDLLLASDYLNLAELRPLLPPPLRDVPAVVYFHENQLTYPLQPGERRDVHFGLTHLYSVLAAEAALFNSDFHRTAFLDALAELLALVPDVDTAPALEAARSRAQVLPLGTDLARGVPRRLEPGAEPVLLWNHRWEYDKDPDAFVRALIELAGSGERFRVRVLGQSFREVPPAFDELTRALGPRIDLHGFVPARGAYLEAVRGAHVVVSTARHEFFGLGTLEAVRQGLLPVLPADLAYPELLPEPERAPGRFLYERSGGVLAPLSRALRAVRDGEWMDARRALIEHTDRFAWPVLAPRFDRVFEQAVGSIPGTRH